MDDTTQTRTTTRRGRAPALGPLDAPRADAPLRRGAGAMRHIAIEGLSPEVDGGRAPAKRCVGDRCVIEADVFRDGHDVISVVLRWRSRDDELAIESPMEPIGNDRWRGELIAFEPGTILYSVAAWTDPYASWLADLRKRVAARDDIAPEVEVGARLLDRAADRATDESDRAVLLEAAADMRASPHAGAAVLAAAARPAVREAATRLCDRADEVVHPAREIVIDPPIARFGAWYEMFPRSAGTDPERSATFVEAARRLPEIADMGFDVLYLPPIHPIGRTARKGPNNAPVAAPGDPGSPWAIGSEAGGHTAVDPALGTLDDFDRFVERADELGLSVALDFAIQCSPDHPWVREHPEWFGHRPDGSIRYAENPPKKYQDIYPIDFDTDDREGLWTALRDVVLFWVDHGVRIFRVDNPHTKPYAFWRWLIAQVNELHPDVVFLSEAFTRPKPMKLLAKMGFDQSYTYFTWRNTKEELESYLRELTTPPESDFFRPNFFANTPDILHEFLQQGGRPAFEIRLVLAATLSPAYGIYSGFELCENVPVRPGSEEYLHSEKYQVRPRDWDAPGNIKGRIARVNEIRHDSPALSLFTNLRFLPTDNDRIIFYVKATPELDDVLLVAVNLDPHAPHHATAWVPPDAVGVAPGQPYEVRDLLEGGRWTWGERNYVRLDPAACPAHILRVERRL